MDGPPPELIASAVEGNRESFARLIELQYDFILKAAWKWTRHQADAEDVAQEVCIRLGRSISQFKGQGRFTTWLYALVLNVVRDLARKGRRERDKGLAWKAEASVSTRVEDESAVELWDAVDQLPEKQRDVVILVYSEGLTHAQTADVLGLAETTVSWHLHEARKTLKSLLTRETSHG
ncbi:ECF RNA polymerase sigma factor SigW [compost metagenome]